jgi:hypothetical protein
MNINKYLRSLLPNFDKTRVLDECRLTRGEIQDVTHPLYEKAAPFIAKHTIKSAEMKELMVVFNRIVKPKGNEFNYIRDSLPEIVDNLEEVEKMIEQVYSEEIAGSGLTFLKANLLQFVECASFVSRYARKLLVFAYIHETAEYKDGGTVLNDSLTPMERDWIKVNFIPFCQALQATTGKTAELKKKLDNIPDIVVTDDNADSLGKTLGQDRMDPLSMGFIPVFLNPIFHVRMMLAEYQNMRYRQAREEMQLLQLRQINLEQLKDGKPDANIQKKIEALEIRIQDQTAKIAKMEKNND